MISIRLRLSLFCSGILTVTLILFGLALYSIQARDTLNALKQDIFQGSQRMVDAALRMNSMPPAQPVQGREPSKPPPPRSFDEFSSEQAFQDLREREIVRIMDANGNLIASPF